AYILYRLNLVLLDQTFCFRDEVRCQEIKDTLQGFVKLRFSRGGRKLLLDENERLRKSRRFPGQQIHVKKVRFHCVVQVCRVVSNLIHLVNQLRFKGWAQIEEIFAEFRRSAGGIVTRMLDDAFADFKREIQTRMSGKALFEVLDDSQR